ncbi:MAG: nuclease-related domain-containing protein, partial [Chthoniobacterales bacterium]
MPGQSVRDERDKLLNDQLLEYVLVAFGFCFLAVWEWLRRWIKLPFAAELMTGAAVLMTAYCVFRIFRLRKEIRNLNQAEKGERRVSELLSQLRRKRYVAFDDLVPGQFNIDHVLVGPGGIFAIETKAYSIFGNECVGVDELGVLRLSNKPAIGDPLNQAAGSAATVAQILKDRMRRDVDVTPVLIFPGWTLKAARTETGVIVLNDGTITDFFEKRPTVLSDAEITNVCSHLDQT